MYNQIYNLLANKLSKFPMSFRKKPSAQNYRLNIPKFGRRSRIKVITIAFVQRTSRRHFLVTAKLAEDNESLFDQLAAKSSCE